MSPENDPQSFALRVDAPLLTHRLDLLQASIEDTTRAASFALPRPQSVCDIAESQKQTHSLNMGGAAVGPVLTSDRGECESGVS